LLGCNHAWPGCAEFLDSAAYHERGGPTGMEPMVASSLVFGTIQSLVWRS
jgi:hypothetical protein